MSKSRKLCVSARCKNPRIPNKSGLCRDHWNSYMREYLSRPEVKAKRQKQRATVEARRKARKARLARDHGLTVEEYDAIEAAQDGRCAICRQDKPLVVDHCHESGKVRGLLCHLCNRAIGFLGDDPIIVGQAAAYLEAHASGV